MLCSHIEATIAAVLQARYASALQNARWSPPNKWQVTVNGVEQQVDSGPVSRSIVAILDDLNNSVRNQPMDLLKKHYRTTFNRSISDVLGESLHSDLVAITSLRNLFAHGRYFMYEFSQTSMDAKQTIVLEKNPLKPALDRLVACQVLSGLDVTAENHSEYTQALFRDEAIQHFYKAVIAIESRLFEVVDFVPETHHLQRPPKLPALFQGV